MFRARLSWTVIGAVGMLGLYREGPLALRLTLLFVALAAFAWLNQMQLLWALSLRRDRDPRWQPMAIGLALRGLALVLALAVTA